MNNLVPALKALIIEAGAIALEAKCLGINVEYKYDNSPVTNADKNISTKICNTLKDLTPNIPIICEESSYHSIQTDTFWFIDPIDGTRSFIRNESSYTVNIGLIQYGLPTLGFIYQPAAKKLYYTDENKTLQIERDSHHISYCPTKHKDKLIGTTGARYFNKFLKHLLQHNLISEIVTISSSIKLCLIAECQVDIYPSLGKTMEWDVAAGHALILAAGGNILDSSGKQLTYGKSQYMNSSFFAFSKNWLERYSKDVILSNINEILT